MGLLLEGISGQLTDQKTKPPDHAKISGLYRGVAISEEELSREGWHQVGCFGTDLIIFRRDKRCRLWNKETKTVYTEYDA